MWFCESYQTSVGIVYHLDPWFSANPNLTYYIGWSSVWISLWGLWATGIISQRRALRDFHTVSMMCFNFVTNECHFTQTKKSSTENRPRQPLTRFQRGNRPPPSTQPIPFASALPTTLCHKGRTGTVWFTFLPCAPTRNLRCLPDCKEMASARRTATL